MLCAGVKRFCQTSNCINRLFYVFRPKTNCHAYSTTSLMNVFDRKAKMQQRNRIPSLAKYEQYEYVKDEIGYRVFDRICDIKRTFETAVDLGCGQGHVTKNMTKAQQLAQHVYMVEMSEQLLNIAYTSPDVPCTKLNLDEEMGLTFEDNSIDLVYSSLSLHWVNNLPGVFKQVFNCLKRDGVFIGSMFGTDTLYELRVSLQLAETEIIGGFSPHISPFTAVRDLGDLLNRSGFTLVTLDSDELIINYPGIWELMKDLQGMGESSCSWSRPLTLRRDVISRAQQIYRERYGDEKSIPASFCILSFIGWKPDPNQPQPAKRGSAELSLQEISRLVGDPSNAKK